MVKEEVDEPTPEVEVMYDEPVLETLEEKTEVVELLEDVPSVKEEVVVAPVEVLQEVKTEVTPIIT